MNNTVYLDGYLKTRCDLMKKYQKKDFDVVFLLDGQEGSGKSTLAITLAHYLSDGNFTVDQICEGSHDAVEKLDHIPKGSILIMDEGSLMFSSKDAMRKEQKALIQILNVIRQKNIILIIVAPSFFDLNKYIAVHRSKCLIHVYTVGLERGRFIYFDERSKKRLYNIGKKNQYSYTSVRASFSGRFTNFKPEWYKDYLKTKEKSLLDAMRKGYEMDKNPKPEIIRAEIINKIKELNPDYSIRKIAGLTGINRSVVHKALQKEKESKTK